MCEARQGFRFFAWDAVALGLGAACAGWGAPWLGTFAWLPLVVLGHFFLFCNVFRVRRRDEMIWSACFLVVFAGLVLSERFTWSTLLAVQTPLTLLAIGKEIASESYRGVGATLRAG